MTGRKPLVRPDSERTQRIQDSDYLHARMSSTAVTLTPSTPQSLTADVVGKRVIASDNSITLTASLLLAMGDDSPDLGIVVIGPGVTTITAEAGVTLTKVGSSLDGGHVTANGRGSLIYLMKLSNTEILLSGDTSDVTA